MSSGDAADCARKVVFKKCKGIISPMLGNLYRILWSSVPHWLGEITKGLTGSEDVPIPHGRDTNVASVWRA